MSLSKAVMMGKVVRNPEKRFTSNNLAITTFAINIGKEDEEALLRVVLAGKLAETAAEKVSKGSTVVVEGKLQTNTVKSADGSERKIVELAAQAFEVAGGAQAAPAQPQAEEEILQFDDDIASDDLIGEDEIPF